MLTMSDISVASRKKNPSYRGACFLLLILLFFLNFFPLIHVYLTITKVVFQVCENNPLPVGTYMVKALISCGPRPLGYQLRNFHS